MLDAQPDNTPMIDVVFLLIIFFLCLEFRTLEAKVPAHLPLLRGGSPSPYEPRPDVRVRIIVDAPGAKLAIRNTRHVLEGHRVHWCVGPTECESIARVREILHAYRSDPEFRETDPRTGVARTGSITVLPERGATYGDVAELVDVIYSVGLDRIYFGR